MAVVLTEKINKELYNQEEFYWLAIVLGVAALFVGGIYLALVSVALYLLFPICFSFIYKKKEERVIEQEVKTQSVDSLKKISFGVNQSGRDTLLSLEDMGHVFVAGITGYGKTRFILSFITEVITKFRHDEVKIAISDAKVVSYNIFAKSKHLYAPIAENTEQTDRLIELLLEEMHKRLNEFKKYSIDNEEICTDVEEYYQLSGIRLPRIVVIFDEIADAIESGSQAEKNLISLAKRSRAAGFNIIIITQRPTKEAISHEVTSQCITFLSTYMKNSTEYGSVAKIPQAIYSDVTAGGVRRGEFMMFSPTLVTDFLAIKEGYLGWGFVQGHFIRNNEIKEIARSDSTNNLTLPTLESSIPAWSGGEDEKMDAIEALEIKLGAVTIEDMVKYFGVGRRTAKTWLEKYNDS